MASAGWPPVTSKTLTLCTACSRVRKQLLPYHMEGQKSHLPQVFASRHPRFLPRVMCTPTRGGHKLALQLVLHLVSSGHWHLVHLVQHEHTSLVTLLL